jgi:Na+/serine symporter
MSDGKRGKMSGPAPLKRNNTARQVSGNVMVSCYIATAAILVIALVEAARSFMTGENRAGISYIVLAVLGVFLSIFITIMNSRNRRLLAKKQIEDTQCLKIGEASMRKRS